jgi:hypothetical protein
VRRPAAGCSTSATSLSCTPCRPCRTRETQPPPCSGTVRRPRHIWPSMRSSICTRPKSRAVEHRSTHWVVLAELECSTSPSAESSDLPGGTFAETVDAWLLHPLPRAGCPLSCVLSLASFRCFSLILAFRVQSKGKEKDLLWWDQI